MKYINVYEVDQSCGGPEEGGWWYDRGEPLASVPIEDEMSPVLVQAERERLTRIFAHLDTERPRTSAAGGTDVVVYVQDEFAKPFPERRPHYE